jgi:YfiR/HmsC-like
MQIVTLTPAKVKGMPSPERVLWVLAVVVLLLSGTRAQSPTAAEYQIKAAFLFNFAKFVEWPPSSFANASAPLRICVFGRDPFGEELRNITKEKTVNGHKLEIDQGIDLQVARTCHILFIASSETARLKQILESLRGTDTLTVSDIKGFVEQGGMINFVLENNRVQFEVNSKAAEQGGLKISSKLLSVAKLVIV